MMNKQTLELLSTIKSPTLEECLQKAIVKGYDAYYNNSHNTWRTDVDVKGLEEFCKILYIDWRNDLINNIDSLQGGYKALATRVRDYEIFNPTNIESRKYNMPFYSFFQKGFKNLVNKIAENPILSDVKDVQIVGKLQNDKMFIPEEDGPDPDNFFRVLGFNFVGQQREKEEARLYLNLMSKNIPSFMKEFYIECRKRELPFQCKFSLCDHRNDTFLLYTSYDRLCIYKDIIEGIKQNSPQLFEGTENINQNLGVIDGYIGYGEEPEVRDSKGGLYSFNSLREEVVNDIVSAVKSEKNKLLPKPVNDSYFAFMKGKHCTFNETCELLLEECMAKNMKTSGNVPNLNVNTFLGEFKSNIQECVLTGKPVKDILWSREYDGKKFSVEIKCSEIDWITRLSSLRGREYKNRTVARGYLCEFIAGYPANSPLKEKENKLRKIIHSTLIKGLKKDLQTSTDEESINKILEKIDIPYEQLGETGRAIVKLASANFLTGKGIQIMLNHGKSYQFNDKLLDLYKQLIGEENFNKIITENCDKYKISANNLCFNASTENLLPVNTNIEENILNI